MARWTLVIAVALWVLLIGGTQVDEPKSLLPNRPWRSIWILRSAAMWA